MEKFTFIFRSVFLINILKARHTKKKRIVQFKTTRFVGISGFRINASNIQKQMHRNGAF